MSGDGSSGDRRSLLVWAATASNAVAALVLGAFKIGRSFNYDEAVTYASFVNGGSPWRALTTQVVFNNHQMFSVIQSIAWRIGLVGESAQRLLPVLCGTATVALLTWWLGRRAGPATGLIAGLLLVLHPVYLEEFRLLRGYALATLATLVATLATERSWSDRRQRWLVLSGVAMTVAVTTHAYSVVALAAMAVVTFALGHLRRDHVVTWGVAAVAAVVIQLPLLDDARAQSAARGSRYRSAFLERSLEVYLGDRRSAIVLTTILLVAGGWSVARRSTRHLVALSGALAVVAAVVLLLWQVLRPLDLYARFFVTLTPFLVALVALGAREIPRRAGFVAAAVLVALLVPGALDTIRREPTIRTAARVVDAARSSGLDVCGAFALPLSVYTEPVPSIGPGTPDDPGGYGSCEVFVAVIGPGAEAEAIAEERFEGRTRLGGGVVVYHPADFRTALAAARDG